MPLALAEDCHTPRMGGGGGKVKQKAQSCPKIGRPQQRPVGEVNGRVHAAE